MLITLTDEEIELFRTNPPKEVYWTDNNNSYKDILVMDTYKCTKLNNKDQKMIDYTIDNIIKSIEVGDLTEEYIKALKYTLKKQQFDKEIHEILTEGKNS